MKTGPGFGLRGSVPALAFLAFLAFLAVALGGLGPAWAEEGPPRALSIEEALGLAAQNAASVKATTAALASARAQVDLASAAWLPRLSLSTSGAWLANPPSGITIGKDSLSPLYHLPSADLVVIKDYEAGWFKGTLSLSQPIVTWGKIGAAVEMAKAGAGAALATRDGALLDTAREVRRAYWSAKLAASGAAILGELRDAAAQIVADTEASLEAGLATRADLLAAKADLAGVESRRVEAEEGLASSLEGLAALTGLSADSPLELSSDFPSTLPEIDEGAWLEAAVAISSARLAAASRLRAAAGKVDEAWGSQPFRPDLAMFASLDASGQTLPLSRKAWSDTWTWDFSLGIALSANLFDGGRARAALGGARADAETAAAALDGAARGARVDARKALKAARLAVASLSAATATSSWTAEVLRNARASARDELVPRRDVARAVIQDARARLDLLEARWSLEEALADLARVAGGGAR